MWHMGLRVMTQLLEVQWSGRNWTSNLRCDINSRSIPRLDVHKYAESSVTQIYAREWHQKFQGARWECRIFILDSEPEHRERELGIGSLQELIAGIFNELFDFRCWQIHGILGLHWKGFRTQLDTVMSKSGKKDVNCSSICLRCSAITYVGGWSISLSARILQSRGKES